MTGGKEAKARLRKMVLDRRNAVDPGTRAASSRVIVRDILGLAAYREARVVLAYAGFGSELETNAFLRHSLDEGKRLLLPRVDRRNRLLEVYEVGDLVGDLEAGAWGIRETRLGRCPVADPRAVDFVLVPGVAFDARGGRLGYGVGFYDRLLAHGVPPTAWRIAGAFEVQMVEEVPMDEHDVPMDAVVTESGRYPPGPLRRRVSPRPL